MQAALEAMAASGGIVELYFTFAVGMLAVAATAFTVQTVLRARAEELSGRSEAVLASATSRHAQLASHATIAIVGTLWLLTLLGAAGAVGYGAVTGNWATGLEGMLGTALAFFPASLVVAGVVLLAVAAVPRAAVAIGWSALAWSLVVGQLGAVLELPQPVLNLSPFTHVPAVPAEPLQVLPLLLLTVLAAGLTAAAFTVHRRRDLVLTA
jgi:ABC-2 type transport system permease protein